MNGCLDVCFQRRQIYHRRRQNQVTRRRDDGVYYRVPPEEESHGGGPVSLAFGADEVPQQRHLSRTGNFFFKFYFTRMNKLFARRVCQVRLLNSREFNF